MGELTEQEEMALYESELKALMEMYPEDYVYPEDNTSIKDVIKSAARLGGALGLLGLEKIGIDTGPIVSKYKGFALGGLATARKGITTKEGMEMAKKGFQLDDKKADLDKDGELSTYERKRGEAVQRAMDNDEVVEMAHGGMACTCGYGGDCGCGEGMMGPIGTTRAETLDDIEVMISEGEYVLPANVVRWHGLKHIMDMQDEAEAGLMMMHSMGLIQEVDPNEEGEEAESDGEDIEDAEVQAADRAAEDEETYETPEGTEIELADGMDVEEEDLDIEEMETPYAKPFGSVTQRKVAVMAY